MIMVIDTEQEIVKVQGIINIKECILLRNLFDHAMETEATEAFKIPYNK